MATAELDVLGLDGMETDSGDGVLELSANEVVESPSKDSAVQSPQANTETTEEPPTRDPEETSAATAFEILDRGKKGFFTAKDVEACCNEADCKVFGSSNIYFRISAYMNRAFPKADPGSVSLEDFEDEWNGKPGSAFRVLINKYRQKHGTDADALEGKLSQRRHSDNVTNAPVSAYRNFESSMLESSMLTRPGSDPIPRGRRRFSDPFSNYETDDGLESAVPEHEKPKPSKLGSIVYKSRQGRKEGVLHEDGMRILGVRGKVYQHVTEFVRTAPFVELFQTEEQPQAPDWSAASIESER